MKNLILLILLVLQFLSVYVLHRNFNSYKEQILVFKAINGGSWKADYEFFANLETTLPNLSVSSLPLKAVKGYYYLINYGYDSLYQAIKLSHEGIKDNPYIMYSEGNLAIYYDAIKMKDSSEKYARKAFKGLPKNAIHFAMIAKMFANNGKYDSIIKSFEKIKDPPQLKVYSTFLASMVNFMDKVDTLLVKKYARLAKYYFPYADKELLILADYALYGQDQVKTAIKLNDKASLLLEQDKINEAIEILREALLIRKGNLEMFQTIGLANYNLGNYTKTIEILEDVRQRAKTEKNLEIDPTSLYFLGLAYYNKKEYSKACEILKLSSDNGLEAATKFYSSVCLIN